MINKEKTRYFCLVSFNSAKSCFLYQNISTIKINSLSAYDKN